MPAAPGMFSITIVGLPEMYFFKKGMSALACISPDPPGSPPRRIRSEEHTSELQSHRDLHSFPTRRSSDLSITIVGLPEMYFFKKGMSALACISPDPPGSPPRRI